MPTPETPPPACRAFLIEDDPLTRQIIGAHAERFGFAAVEVEPTIPAIGRAIAAAGADDVVILDIILGPDLDGFEVIRLLGQMGFRGRVIVVSGFGPDYLQPIEALAGALSVRIAGTLEKPVRPADLQRCLLGDGG